jgi:hypothetical protein
VLFDEGKMMQHMWHFVSATREQQSAVSDGTRRGGTRIKGGGLSAGGGRQRLVGRRKVVGSRGWWAKTVETRWSEQKNWAESQEGYINYFSDLNKLLSSKF